MKTRNGKFQYINSGNLCFLSTLPRFITLTTAAATTHSVVALHAANSPFSISLHSLGTFSQPLFHFPHSLSPHARPVSPLQLPLHLHFYTLSLLFPLRCSYSTSTEGVCVLMSVLCLSLCVVLQLPMLRFFFFLISVALS